MGCDALCFVISYGSNGRHKVRKIIRKLAAITGLLALLLPGFAVLVTALSAADVLACCNTAYCPLHHRQAPDSQNEKSDCDAARNPGMVKSSMRACDAAPAMTVAMAPFVLATPAALRTPSGAGAVTFTIAVVFRGFTAVPLSPPPRALAS
jgi:hypothetical protein